jgi:hypothetical protein
VAAALLATRPRSAVSRRLTRLAPRAAGASRIAAMLVRGELARSGFGWTGEELLRAKVIVGVTFAASAAVASAFLPIGPAIVALAGYCGFVLPTLRVERAAGRRRIEAERALVTLVEWTEALVASGRPVETAVVAVASRGVGAALIDGALAAASRSYALGAPLFRALAHEASVAGLTSLAGLAGELDGAREVGRGALTVLRDERERLRASERARSLDAAGRVEGRLMLVLVLCYLPALMLLVVIPLFLSLLDGLSV